MRTRNSYFPNNSNVTIPRRRNKGRAPNIVEPKLRTIVAPMAKRTMEELLRAPTEGYREAIILPKINADHFEIKTNLLQLVQANPFYGHESENPHAHINIDTFYNGLNKNEQDSLNAAAGGNLLSKTTREALNIIENKSKVCYSRNRSNASRMNATSSKMDERIDKLADQLLTLVEIVSKKVVTPAPVKAVEETCDTCGGAHSWYNCPATDNNQVSVCVIMGTYNQVNPPNRVSNQMAPPASTSGTLPSNTIPNPNGEMKAITTRSGVAYEGPSIPTNPSPKKVVERETKETTDKEQTIFQGSAAQIPPPVIPTSIPESYVPKTLPKTTSILEPDVPKSLPKPNIPYPSRRDDQKSCDKASNQMEKIFQIFQDLRFDISFADDLLLMPRFAPTIKSLLMNKEKLLELAKIPLNENCSTMLLKKLPEKLGDPGKFLIPSPDLLGFSNSLGGNPTPTSEPFTSEFILEEIEAYLKNDSISLEIDYADCDPEEDICLIEKLLNNDPFQLPPMDLKQSKVTKAKSSIEEPPELELKDLPSHLEYAFLEENDKAIAWKITDIKGIDPRFCTHKILMEDDYKPTVQSQRRVNPKIHEVIKKEVLKLLDAGMIYPISDSPWVSPVHCVPKKGGITVVANEENELIPTRLVTGWRVCIDYRKLNEATRKDHFPLPFMDQMLERLAGNEFYCFLDGFSGYFQIPIDPQDQEKTTFTCPYGTFAYRRMPFGLCNALGTFQRCMMAIFHDMIEKTMEVFMDDFSVFGDSFDSCLSNLEKMLKRSRGFYRRFIQDFSKIAKPMTHLLEKETPFVFSKDCIDAFQTLKKKLTEAPILVVPDWNLPFELMCDASDFAIGAVLGQRKMKHFQPIHYASKTMTEA
ncbi:reverse transcriptase domain-containing protein [Tanacetum coccineum]|uniref:Reverse transcriptase domain-containing protein n=1 Tax=Tanacetum coccineum TaxID=301880 RepID=A0ABQ5GWI9_9ASTR